MSMISKYSVGMTCSCETQSYYDCMMQKESKPQIKQQTAARYCASKATFRIFLPNDNFKFQDTFEISGISRQLGLLHLKCSLGPSDDRPGLSVCDESIDRSIDRSIDQCSVK